ncbi:hypothetical protein FNF31_07547 [Cafeteria roenbergensis]|uniref:Uncharacterized protein n=1 Tax=Cafeteria roenbergensis TaxID=33653 RepID=A0A5A8C4E4_CAFRO|nr:hypothetical protein FNF31_07547 [Cafeteria roenbergensis]
MAIPFRTEGKAARSSLAMSTGSAAPFCGPNTFASAAAAGAACLDCPSAGWSVVLALVACGIYTAVLSALVMALRLGLRRRGAATYSLLRGVLEHLGIVGAAGAFLVAAPAVMRVAAWVQGFGLVSVAFTGTPLECAFTTTMGAQPSMAVRTAVELLIVPLGACLVWWHLNVLSAPDLDPVSLVTCGWALRSWCSRKTLPPIDAVIRQHIAALADASKHPVEARHLLDLAVRPFDARGIHSPVRTEVDARLQMLGFLAKEVAAVSDAKPRAARGASDGGNVAASSAAAQQQLKGAVARIGLDLAAPLASPRSSAGSGSRLRPRSRVGSGPTETAEPDTTSNAVGGIASREVLLAAARAANPDQDPKHLDATMVARDLTAAGPSPTGTLFQLVMQIRLRDVAARHAAQALPAAQQRTKAARLAVDRALGRMARAPKASEDSLRCQGAIDDARAELAVAEANEKALMAHPPPAADEAGEQVAELIRMELVRRFGALHDGTEAFAEAVKGSGVVEAAVECLAARVKSAGLDTGADRQAPLGALPRDSEAERGDVDPLEQPLTVATEAETGLVSASVGAWADARADVRKVAAGGRPALPGATACLRGDGLCGRSPSRAVLCTCSYVLDVLCCFSACGERLCGCPNPYRGAQLRADPLARAIAGEDVDRSRHNILPVSKVRKSVLAERRRALRASPAERDRDVVRRWLAPSVSGGESPGVPAVEVIPAAAAAGTGASTGRDSGGRGGASAGGGSTAGISGLGSEPGAVSTPGLSKAALKQARLVASSHARSFSRGSRPSVKAGASSRGGSSGHRSARTADGLEMPSPRSGRGHQRVTSGASRASSGTGRRGGGTGAGSLGAGTAARSDGGRSRGGSAGGAGSEGQQQPQQPALLPASECADPFMDELDRQFRLYETDGGVLEVASVAGRGSGGGGLAAAAVGLAADSDSDAGGDVAVVDFGETAAMSADAVYDRALARNAEASEWAAVLAEAGAASDALPESFDDAVAWACCYEAFRLTGVWPGVPPPREMQAAMALRLAAAAVNESRNFGEFAEQAKQAETAARLAGSGFAGDMGVAAAIDGAGDIGPSPSPGRGANASGASKDAATPPKLGADAGEAGGRNRASDPHAERDAKEAGEGEDKTEEEAEEVVVVVDDVGDLDDDVMAAPATATTAETAAASGGDGNRHSRVSSAVDSAGGLDSALDTLDSSNGDWEFPAIGPHDPHGRAAAGGGATVVVTGRGHHALVPGFRAPGRSGSRGSDARHSPADGSRQRGRVGDDDGGGSSGGHQESVDTDDASPARGGAYADDGARDATAGAVGVLAAAPSDAADVAASPPADDKPASRVAGLDHDPDAKAPAAVAVADDGKTSAAAPRAGLPAATKPRRARRLSDATSAELLLGATGGPSKGHLDFEETGAATAPERGPRLGKRGRSRRLPPPVDITAGPRTRPVAASDGPDISIGGRSGGWGSASGGNRDNGSRLGALALASGFAGQRERQLQAELAAANALLAGARRGAEAVADRDPAEVAEEERQRMRREQVSKAAAAAMRVELQRSQSRSRLRIGSGASQAGGQGSNGGGSGGGSMGGRRPSLATKRSSRALMQPVAPSLGARSGDSVGSRGRGRSVSRSVASSRRLGGSRRGSRRGNSVRGGSVRGGSVRGGSVLGGSVRGGSVLGGPVSRAVTPRGVVGLQQFGDLQGGMRMPQAHGSPQSMSAGGRGLLQPLAGAKDSGAISTMANAVAAVTAAARGPPADTADERRLFRTVVDNSVSVGAGAGAGTGAGVAGRRLRSHSATGGADVSAAPVLRGADARTLPRSTSHHRSSSRPERDGGAAVPLVPSAQRLEIPVSDSESSGPVVGRAPPPAASDGGSRGGGSRGWGAARGGGVPAIAGRAWSPAGPANGRGGSPFGAGLLTGLSPRAGSESAGGGGALLSARGYDSGGLRPAEERSLAWLGAIDQSVDDVGAALDALAPRRALPSCESLDDMESALISAAEDQAEAEEARRAAGCAHPFLVAALLSLPTVAARAALGFAALPGSDASRPLTVDGLTYTGTPAGDGALAMASLAAIAAAAAGLAALAWLCFPCGRWHRLFSDPLLRELLAPLTSGTSARCFSLPVLTALAVFLMGTTLAVAAPGPAALDSAVAWSAAVVGLWALAGPRGSAAVSPQETWAGYSFAALLLTVVAQYNVVPAGAEPTSLSDFSAGWMNAVLPILWAVMLVQSAGQCARQCDCLGGGRHALSAEREGEAQAAADEAAAGRQPGLGDPCCGRAVSCWTLCPFSEAGSDQRRRGEAAAAARATLVRLRSVRCPPGQPMGQLPGMEVAGLRLTQAASGASSGLPMPPAVHSVDATAASPLAPDLWLAWGLSVPLCCWCGAAVRGSGWSDPDLWHRISGFAPRIPFVGAGAWLSAGSDDSDEEAGAATASVAGSSGGGGTVGMEVGGATARGADEASISEASAPPSERAAVGGVAGLDAAFAGGSRARRAGFAGASTAAIAPSASASAVGGRPAVAEALGRDAALRYAEARQSLATDVDAVSCCTVLCVALPGMQGCCGADWRPPTEQEEDDEARMAARSKLVCGRGGRLPTVSALTDPHERVELAAAVKLELAVEQAKRASALLAHDLRLDLLPAPLATGVRARVAEEAAWVVREATAVVASTQALQVRDAVAALDAAEAKKIELGNAIETIRLARSAKERKTREQLAEHLRESIRASKAKQAALRAEEERKEEEGKAVAKAQRLAARARQQELVLAARRGRQSEVAAAYRDDPTLAANDVLGMYRDQQARIQRRSAW